MFVVVFIHLYNHYLPPLLFFWLLLCESSNNSSSDASHFRRARHLTKKNFKENETVSKNKNLRHAIQNGDVEISSGCSVRNQQILICEQIEFSKVFEFICECNCSLSEISSSFEQRQSLHDDRYGNNEAEFLAQENYDSTTYATFSSSLASRIEKFGASGGGGLGSAMSMALCHIQKYVFNFFRQSSDRR